MQTEKRSNSWRRSRYEMREQGAAASHATDAAAVGGRERGLGQRGKRVRYDQSGCNKKTHAAQNSRSSAMQRRLHVRVWWAVGERQRNSVPQSQNSPSSAMYSSMSSLVPTRHSLCRWGALICSKLRVIMLKGERAWGERPEGEAVKCCSQRVHRESRRQGGHAMVRRQGYR